MTNITARTSSRPHVKWGSLVGSVAIVLIALTLIVLNLTKTLTGVLAIDVFIAYGPIVAFFLSFVGIGLFIENFMPSFAKYKEYKAKKAYVKAVQAAIRESVRSNHRKDSSVYQKFLEENPKYTV